VAAAGTRRESHVGNGRDPAIADANSITYVLHKKVGDYFSIDTGTGREVSCVWWERSMTAFCKARS